MDWRSVLEMGSSRMFLAPRPPPVVVGIGSASFERRKVVFMRYSFVWQFRVWGACPCLVSLWRCQRGRAIWKISVPLGRSSSGPRRRLQSGSYPEFGFRRPRGN
eukprot:3652036-Pyramimonas_sp.AAC.1